MRWIMPLILLGLIPLACSSNKSTNNETPGITVSVGPLARVVIDLNDSTHFEAYITGTTDERVTWLAQDIVGGDSTFGTISTTGWYKAPASEPIADSIKITARSMVDLSKTGNAWVFLHDPTVYYVDNTNGNDTNGDGSSGHPFRTISFALTNSFDDNNVQTIRASAGVYDIAHGESFPLRIRDGLTLRGAGMAATRITAQGGTEFLRDTVIALNNNLTTTIDSMHISTENKNGIGIIINGTTPSTRVKILRSQIDSCYTGIITDGAVASLLQYNNISNNQIGISTRNASRPIIRNCSITQDSTYGIEILDNAKPDLGTRDTLNFRGGNSINFGNLNPAGRWLIRNMNADIIWAVGNQWQSPILDDNDQYIYDNEESGGSSGPVMLRGQ